MIGSEGAKTHMTRLRGWSARGLPLVDKVPHGHWRTLTFLAALRCDRIDAPLVLDGPINGQSFTAMSNSSCCRPSRPATSSSWTISAAIRARRSASSFDPSAPGSCSCRHTAPT